MEDFRETQWDLQQWPDEESMEAASYQRVGESTPCEHAAGTSESNALGDVRQDGAGDANTRTQTNSCAHVCSSRSEPDGLRMMPYSQSWT